MIPGWTNQAMTVNHNISVIIKEVALLVDLASFLEGKLGGSLAIQALLPAPVNSIDFF